MPHQGTLLSRCALSLWKSYLNEVASITMQHEVVWTWRFLSGKHNLGRQTTGPAAARPWLAAVFVCVLPKSRQELTLLPSNVETRWIIVFPRAGKPVRYQLASFQKHWLGVFAAWLIETVNSVYTLIGSLGCMDNLLTWFEISSEFILVFPILFGKQQSKSTCSSL